MEVKKKTVVVKVEIGRSTAWYSLVLEVQWLVVEFEGEECCLEARGEVVMISTVVPILSRVSGNWTCCSMLFFKLLFSYVFLAISFYVFLLNLF